MPGHRSPETRVPVALDPVRELQVTQTHAVATLARCQRLWRELEHGGKRGRFPEHLTLQQRPVVAAHVRERRDEPAAPIEIRRCVDDADVHAVRDLRDAGRSVGRLRVEHLEPGGREPDPLEVDERAYGGGHRLAGNGLENFTEQHVAGVAVVIDLACRAVRCTRGHGPRDLLRSCPPMPWILNHALEVRRIGRVIVQAARVLEQHVHCDGRGVVAA